MKINLAENMLRFGAKNLTKATKQKLERLAEQNVEAGSPTPATVKQIPGSTINYVVGDGSSDQAVKAPLAVITSTDLDIMKYNGSTTDKVVFGDDFIRFGNIAADSSETKYSSSVKPIDIPTSFVAVEKIASFLRSDVSNTLKALVWLNQNHGSQLKLGSTIIENLKKLTNTNALETTYAYAVKKRMGLSPLAIWKEALAAAGILK